MDKGLGGGTYGATVVLGGGVRSLLAPVEPSQTQDYCK